MSDQERFWSKVDKSGDCWIYKGTIGDAGYGIFKTSKRCSGYRKDVKAHRYAYEIQIGPIDGETLDHLCHTEAVRDGTCLGGPSCPHRVCVNPAHLEPVSYKENKSRAFKAPLVTRCLRDHEYTVENTYFYADGSRGCKACVKVRRGQLTFPE